MKFAFRAKALRNSVFPILRLMKCSVCSTKIEFKYCPTCGQFFKAEKLTATSLLKDLFSNMFAIEKSFVTNLKTGLVDPSRLIINYWNGFRGYYFSPGKFLVLAGLFFLIQMTLFDKFLGLQTNASLVPQQFVFLVFIIFFFSIVGWVVYWNFGKTIHQHLIANIYNASIWTMVIVPLSMILDLLNVPDFVNTAFAILFLLMILIWNSRVFEMSNLKRAIYVLVNAMLFGLIFWSQVQF